MAISKSPACPTVSRNLQGRSGTLYVPCVAVHEEWYSFSLEKDSRSINGRDSKTCTDCARLGLSLLISNSFQVLEVAEGIRYIHSEGMVHGDLRGVRPP